MAIAVAVIVLAWGASAIAVYAVSSGRVFDGARIDALPHQRAAVVMGCVRTLPNGLDNLYFSRRKRVHGAETDLQAVNGGNGMCNYPVSNIQYPLSNDGGANWILAVGYLHISTFNKKE